MPASTFNFHPLEESTGVGWFQELQKKAWEQFSQLPSPGRHDEAWRFSSIGNIALEGFHQAPPPTDEQSILERSQGITPLAAQLVFGNNRLIHADTSNLPQGVILVSLQEAIKKHEDLFRRYFMKEEARLGSLKLAMLHLSQLKEGVFLYVAPGVVVDKPIEIWHWVQGNRSALFPHTLLVAGAGSHLAVIEHFSSLEEEPLLACSLSDVVAEEKASIHHVTIQDWSPQAVAFHLNTTSVLQEGSATSLQLHRGGHFVRSENDSRLFGKGAKSMMLSIVSAHGAQEFDQRTLQDHLSPEAKSDLLYHNALSDQARTIFSGLIKVQKRAHRTDAYQKVSNLMLSDDAEANSMPGLEILADDVRCTHGATSGELNKEELFYMMARGIDESRAVKLLVRGFFQTVLERLEEPQLKNYLQLLLDHE